MMPRPSPVWTLLLGLVAACSGDDGGGSTGTDGTGSTGATGSSTDGSSGGFTDSAGSTGGATDGDGSTGGSSGGGVRVLYREQGEDAERRLLAVDVVDGVVGRPQVVTPLRAGFVLDEPVRYSEDGRWLAYEVLDPFAGPNNLHLVEVGAAAVGEPVWVSGDPVPTPGAVGLLAFSSDSSVLAFIAGALSGGDDLYLVDVSGAQPGATVRLNPETSPTDGITGFELSADGTKIAYVGSIDDGIQNLYVQNADPANPGTPVQVTTNADPTASLHSPGWAAGTEWIQYREDVDADGIREVFLVDVSGTPGTPIELDPADTLMVRGPGLAPDMRGYAYWHGDGMAGDMYYASFNGTGFETPVLISSIGGGADVWGGGLAWSPDSNWLVYLAEHDTAGMRELYAVDMSGATPAPPAKVNGALLTDTDVSGPWFSPEGTHIYYHAAQDTMDRELYRASVSEGALGTDERVHAQTLHNFGSPVFGGENQLVFAGDAGGTGGGAFELYLADLTANPPDTIMASAPTAAGVNPEFQLSRDGRFIAYSGADPTPNPVFLVDLDGAGAGRPMEVAPESFGSEKVILLP